ncbi:MAG: 1-acyl-sn-glycerol-3-phosphate acyltransferase [Candidatus Heimdallarchaeota archaeon]|nr:MAG: 1-acyl-sn-glycerol-3-phosphate acyltransferase [Candidatus Heimdallarchaeota archaeon]
MLLLPPKTTPRSWSLPHRLFYQFVKLILPRIIRRYFRFEVNGIENTTNFPEGIPVIYCFNHRSHLDTFIFASALVYPFGNRTSCGLMASGKAMEQKFFGLLKYLGAFPVYSQDPNPALDYAIKLLKENLAVLIAPQGKRIPSNPIHDYHHLIREAKSGVGRVILRLNGKIPVVPMYIHGSHEALSQGKIVPKFKSFISISFCKPLLFKKYNRKKGWSDSDPDFYSTANKISKRIMVSIRDEMIVQESYFFEIIKKKE